jgi:hypothetical protein
MEDCELSLSVAPTLYGGGLVVDSGGRLSLQRWTEDDSPRVNGWCVCVCVYCVVLVV